MASNYNTVSYNEREFMDMDQAEAIERVKKMPGAIMDKVQKFPCFMKGLLMLGAVPDFQGIFNPVVSKYEPKEDEVLVWVSLCTMKNLKVVETHDHATGDGAQPDANFRTLHNFSAIEFCFRCLMVVKSGIIAGKLVRIPLRGCLVFENGHQRAVTLSGVHFQGGAVVCKGCVTHFTKVVFYDCNLIVLEGAQVRLTEFDFRGVSLGVETHQKPTPLESTLSMYAHGANTRVDFQCGNFLQGAQAMKVDSGAQVVATDLNIYCNNKVCIEVLGLGSAVTVDDCNIEYKNDSEKPASNCAGIHVYRNSEATLYRSEISGMQKGVLVNTNAEVRMDNVTFEDCLEVSVDVGADSNANMYMCATNGGETGVSVFRGGLVMSWCKGMKHSDAVKIVGAEEGFVEESVFKNCTNGIFVKGMSSPRVFLDLVDISGCRRGVFIQDGNVKVTDTRLYHNGKEQSGGVGWGMFVIGKASNVLAVCTCFNENGSAGIYMLDGGRALLRNCEFIYNGGYGLEMDEGGCFEVVESRIAHNTKGRVSIEHVGKLTTVDVEYNVPYIATEGFASVDAPFATW